MSIQITCNQCGSALSIPDEIIGQAVRCPHCHNEQIASPSGNEISHYPPENPPLPPIRESGNPYQAPMEIRSTVYEKPPTGELVHTKIGFSNLFSCFWNTMIARIGPCALFGLVLFLISILLVVMFYVLILVAVIGGTALMVGNNPNQPPTFNPNPAGIALIVAMIVVVTVVSIVIGTYIMLGLFKFSIHLARGGNGEASYAFVDLPTFFRGLRLFILQYFISFLVGIVMLIPFGLLAWNSIMDIDWSNPGAIAPDKKMQLNLLYYGFQFVNTVIGLIIAVKIGWSGMFVVDRGSGAIESLKNCIRYSSRNFFVIFGVGFLLWILSTILIVMTCGLASVIVYPGYGIFAAVIYLMCTGQPLGFPPSGTDMSSHLESGRREEW